MSHYYNQNGELINRIEGKNGNPRKTNIKDARELKLFPSVTELLKIFDKPALSYWKVSEAIKYTLKTPINDQESTESYVARVMSGCYEKSDVAKDFGSDMHFAIEMFLKKGERIVPDYMREFWPSVETFLVTNRFKGEAEKVIVDVEQGFAGTCDFQGQAFGAESVIDFKTQGTLDKDKKPKKIIFYDDWRYQLAGYTMRDKKQCVSVVISSDEPGRIEYKVWTNEEMVLAKLVFKRLCEIFSLVKGLPFSWWRYEMDKMELEEKEIILKKRKGFNKCKNF